MIADKIENLSAYPQLAVYEADLVGFLDKMKRENLPDGRYDLRGDELFALVQRYETRPLEGARMESHKLYADLQYIHSGREWIYVDFTDELTVYEDRTPGADILFYEIRPNKGGTLLSAGMFGYYGPQDAHMPCIMVDGPEKGIKVVFKIRVK